MALLTYADFRSATLNEVCYQLGLTTTEAPDAAVTSAITRLQARLDEWCNDDFETASETLYLDGSGHVKLVLPKRCTAVTTVSILATDGTTYTAQDTGAYRLHSSLYATGSKRRGNYDWLQVTPAGTGLTGLPIYSNGPWHWPTGTNVIKIVGSFGWTTAPGDIKRALALMVYDHFKARRADLRVAESVTGGDTVVRYRAPDPSLGIYTGIDEVDGIIAEYRREPFMAIA